MWCCEKIAGNFFILKRIWSENLWEGLRSVDSLCYQASWAAVVWCISGRIAGKVEKAAASRRLQCTSLLHKMSAPPLTSVTGL